MWSLQPRCYPLLPFWKENMPKRYRVSAPSAWAPQWSPSVVSMIKDIRLREPVLDPDALIVQDPTLFNAIDVFNGLSNDGYLLINTGRTIEELGIEKAVEHLPKERVCIVPATEIALKYVKRPVPNAVLLGALSAITGVIKLESVVQAIETKFPGKVGQGEYQCCQGGLRNGPGGPESGEDKC